MKKLLKLLLVLIVLLAIAVGVALWNANSIIARYKPELERTASSTLGTPVALGGLTISFLPTTRVQVDQFSLGGSKPGEGFTVRNVSLNVALLPLLSKRLEIVSLSVSNPEVTLIKSKSGITIAGLPKAAPAERGADAAKKSEAPAAENKGPIELPIALKLKEFKLDHAKVTLHDEDTKQDLRVSDIDVRAALELAGTAVRVPSVSGGAKLLGSLPLAFSGGDISFDQSTQKAEAKRFDIEILGSTIHTSASWDLKAAGGAFTVNSAGIKLEALEALETLVPNIKSFGLRGSIAPDLKGAVRLPSTFDVNGSVKLAGIGAKAGPAVVSDLGGTLALSAKDDTQQVTSSDLALKIGGQPITAALEAAAKLPSLKLTKLEVKGFGGGLNLGAGLSLAGAKPFNADVDLQGMKIDQLMAAIQIGGAGAAKINGTLSKVKAKVDGSLSDLLPSVKGNASLLLVDGSIEGVNLAHEVLGSISNLPFLSGQLLDRAPPGQKASLDTSSTSLKSLSGDFLIGGSALRTSNLALQSGLFDLTAQGSATFALDLDFGASIAFSKEFSGSLAGSVNELHSALDQNGRLVIPLTIKGVLPAIHVYPDTQKLLKSAAGRAVTEKAGELLGKALGGGKKAGGLGSLFGK